MKDIRKAFIDIARGVDMYPEVSDAILARETAHNCVKFIDDKEKDLQTARVNNDEDTIDQTVFEVNDWLKLMPLIKADVEKKYRTRTTLYHRRSGNTRHNKSAAEVN